MGPGYPSQGRATQAVLHQPPALTIALATIATPAGGRGRQSRCALGTAQAGPDQAGLLVGHTEASAVCWCLHGALLRVPWRHVYVRVNVCVRVRTRACVCVCVCVWEEAFALLDIASFCGSVSIETLPVEEKIGRAHV